jgi:hypothetical protein
MFGAARLRISGPGLDRPIVVGAKRLTPDNGWDRRVQLTSELLGDYYPLEPPGGESHVITGKDGTQIASAELGPRFTLSYRLDFYVHRLEQVRLVQHVYPFARLEPVAFTPPGQTIPHFEGGREPVPAGWQTYSKRALRVLHELGLPESAPVLKSTVDLPATPASGTEAGGPGGIGIAAIGAALAGLALTRRKKPAPA